MPDGRKPVLRVGYLFDSFCLSPGSKLLTEHRSAPGGVRKSPPAAWCVAGGMLAATIKTKQQKKTTKLELGPLQRQDRTAQKGFLGIWPES